MKIKATHVLSMPIDQAPNGQEVTLLLEDGLDTLVTGPYLETLVFNVVVDSSPVCNATEYQLPADDSLLYNIVYETTIDQTCDVRFHLVTPALTVHVTTHITQCSDQRIYDADTKTCRARRFWERPAVIVILCLLVLLVLILGVQLGRWWWIKRRDRALAQTEIPDFSQGDRKCTLKDILNNPNINYIPLEQIHITGKLGSGAHGAVSSGIWRKPKPLGGFEEMPVAIKELHAIFEMTDDVMQEFMVEIAVTSALHHKNVVKFIGVSTRSDNDLLLLTEVMERGSLQTLLMKKGKNMPWRLRLKLALDAAKGMVYLHQRKLIHRDIKTGTTLYSSYKAQESSVITFLCIGDCVCVANLLVDQHWRCKVADFGIAKLKPTVSKTMTAIGTPAYMAPEVLLKSRYSEKADVFSFAIVLNELYTGRMPYQTPPFSKMNQIELSLAISRDGARPDCGTMPAPLLQLITDCWATDPRIRPSFQEIVLRLRRLAEMNLPDGHIGTAYLVYDGYNDTATSSTTASSLSTTTGGANATISSTSSSSSSESSQPSAGGITDDDEIAAVIDPRNLDDELDEGLTPAQHFGPEHADTYSDDTDDELYNYEIPDDLDSTQQSRADSSSTAYTGVDTLTVRRFPSETELKALLSNTNE